MLYTRLYTIRKSFKDLLKKLKDEQFNGKKVSALRCYIQLFNNLVEEVFKIHFYDILESEDPSMEIGNGLDFEYYYSVILEDKEQLDKHIPEIELFRIVTKMILYVLDETKIKKDSIIYKEITTICNIVKNYKFYNKNDIQLDSLDISPLFIINSESDCIQVYEELEEFLMTYLLRENIPELLRRYLHSIEALVIMDILEWGNGYTTYKLNENDSSSEEESESESEDEELEELKEELQKEVEEDNEQIQIFHELNFLKGFIYITSTVAKGMKNEFSTEELYNQFQNDCNEFLILE